MTSTVRNLLFTTIAAAFLFSPLSAHQAQALTACQDPRADINRDGTINVFDVAILSQNFFKIPLLDPRADINQDGRADLLDFHILQLSFTRTCPSPTPVPSASPTLSPSPSASVQPTPSVSPSPSPSPSPTPRPTPSPTPSPSPSPSPNPSPSPSTGVTYSVNGSGMISKNGQPFFPFGFYHVSDIGNRYNAQLAQDVDVMGQAGFNIIQMPITWENGIADTAAARQKAKDHNMVIIASYYKPSLNQWLTAMKNDPVIMGWNTADDFNVPYSNPKTPPSAVKTYNDQLLSTASSMGYTTYTYGSGGGYPFNAGQIPYLFGAYKDSSMSFMGVQVYPIGNNDDSFKGAPLEESLAYYRYARQQAPGKAIMANLQTFAWQNNSGGCGQFPSVKELRNMTYGALNEGMNGFLAYAYHEECGIRTHANEWQEMVKLRQDINGNFLNAILQGNRTVRDTASLTAKNARIHATFWSTTQNGKTVYYVVALNTTQSASATTTDQLGLPGTWSNPRLTPVMNDSSRYPRTMTLHSANGKWFINGTLGAQDVQVYLIDQP